MRSPDAFVVGRLRQNRQYDPALSGGQQVDAGAKIAPDRRIRCAIEPRRLDAVHVEDPQCRVVPDQPVERCRRRYRQRRASIVPRDIPTFIEDRNL
jgi:hypothetical protein